MNYLASPPLVIAYALAGTMDFDFEIAAARPGTDGAGCVPAGHLAGPRRGRGDRRHRRSTAEMFAKDYADVFAGDDAWRGLPTPDGRHLRVGRGLDLRAQAPVLRGHHRGAGPGPATSRAPACSRSSATPSPPTTSPRPAPSSRIARRATYLAAHGVARKDFNSLRIAPRQPRGDDSRHVREHPPAGTCCSPTRTRARASRAASRAISSPASRTPSIDAAECLRRPRACRSWCSRARSTARARRRDWAAKGTRLLGVRAVIAESFERIHRSNLIGMGVLPLQYPAGRPRRCLGLDGTETFDDRGCRRL